MSEILNELHKLDAEFKSAIDRADEAATQRLNDEIAKLESKMRDLERAANRPSAQSNEDAAEAEYKSAFDRYMRGQGPDALNQFKAMSAGTPSQGGYTVPKVIANQIHKLMVDVSPIRQLARVLQVETTDFHLPVSTGGTKSGWVGETDSRTNTDTSVFTEILPTFGELYAKPVVTQTLLEDSQFDIQGFVAGEVATEFNRAEGKAFLLGTGTKQPTGLLTATTTNEADSARAFGTVQYVASGKADGFAATNPADALINIVHSLQAGYRPGAKWVMNKATLGLVRTFKDSTGRYIWERELSAGNPSTILGYEVVEAEDMPNVGAGALPIGFGDFYQAYTIADRVGMSMQVDPYTQMPYVVYNARKRVGGNVFDTKAYKLLKIAAS